MLDILRKYYLDVPFEVSLETFAKCNAACTFCPYPTLDRIGERMPDELIDKLMDELSIHPLPFYFSPFKVNEPLLDKRTLSLCERVNKELPKAALRLFSNGSALTENSAIRIACLQNVEHFWVSLNSHDPAQYKALMGLDFERTAANLDMLHGLVEGGRFTHPVVVSKVADGKTDGAFMDLIRTRWPRFESQWIKRDGWLGYVEPGSPEIPDAACVRWFELSITATGVVSLCCMDGRAEFPIGDIRKNTIWEIYNAPAYRERREKMLSRKQVHPCGTCTY